MAMITIKTAEAHALLHKVCEWEIARARIIGVLKDATPRTDDIEYPETFYLPDLKDRTRELIEELRRHEDYMEGSVFAHE